MKQNWLIRTASNKIIGPVTKEKLLELIANGTLSGEDEVSSGNGYWFYLRERKLVRLFIEGNSIQGFNPISEAPDKLTQDIEIQDKEKIPTLEDISEMEEPGGIEQHPSAYRESGLGDVKKKSENMTQKKTSSFWTKVDQNYFKIVAILIFIILVLIVLNRRKIILSEAHAQENQIIKTKKKAF